MQNIVTVQSFISTRAFAENEIKYVTMVKGQRWASNFFFNSILAHQNEKTNKQKT